MIPPSAGSSGKPRCLPSSLPESSKLRTNPSGWPSGRSAAAGWRRGPGSGTWSSPGTPNKQNLSSASSWIGHSGIVAQDRCWIWLVSNWRGVGPELGRNAHGGGHRAIDGWFQPPFAFRGPGWSRSGCAPLWRWAGDCRVLPKIRSMTKRGRLAATAGRVRARPWARRWAVLLPMAALVTGCGAGGTHHLASPAASMPSSQLSPSPAPPSPTSAMSPTAGRPCGLGGIGPAHLQHVVLIVMENRSYGEIVGSSSAPYFNGLARICGLATNYSAVAHPSLPNYLALTSGSNQGVTDDSGPATHPIAGPSLFSLLGSNWRSLEQSMPANCDLQSGGEYAVKHNPAAYYTGIRAACAQQDVPLQRPPDISAAFTFITPNLCNDMHDCSTATGDAWLAHEIPLLLATPQYLSGQTVIFVTWDESTGSTQQVPALVIAPTVPAGARVSIAYNHYSLVRTVEQLLQLSPLLGNAASATSMVAGFNL